MAKPIPIEQLVILHNELGTHPLRDPARKAMIEEFAQIFGVTASTVYRKLRQSVDFSHHTG